MKKCCVKYKWHYSNSSQRVGNELTFGYERNANLVGSCFSFCKKKKKYSLFFYSTLFAVIFALNRTAVEAPVTFTFVMQ